MLFIGIDPGKQGSLCFLDPSVNLQLFISLNPDKQTAASIIYNIETQCEAADNWIIALEEIHSLYGMSAKSNFTFGGMFWRARTILDCMGADFELVQPKAWQQAVGVPAKKDRPDDTPLKYLVADIASKLYPSAQLYGPRGGLMDGRSDALMIAHYLRLKHGG
jgi:hypothetical protein